MFVAYVKLGKNVAAHKDAGKHVFSQSTKVRFTSFPSDKL